MWAHWHTNSDSSSAPAAASPRLRGSPRRGERAEDVGIDVAFNCNHFCPLYGDPDGAHFEC